MSPTVMNDYCPICMTSISDNDNCFRIMDRIFAHHKCIRFHLKFFIKNPEILFRKDNEERKRYENGKREGY